MAATFTTQEVFSDGDHRVWAGTFTPDTSYPGPGGYPITPALAGCGGSAFSTVVVAGMPIAGANAATRLAAYDPSTQKLKVFTAVGTEAVNGTDQSGATFQVFGFAK